MECFSDSDSATAIIGCDRIMRGLMEEIITGVRAARALSPKPHVSYLDLCCLDARTVVCFPYLF
jgi:hypothetical protein